MGLMKKDIEKTNEIKIVSKKKYAKNTSLKVFVTDFFKHFLPVIKTEDDLSKLAEDFSKAACELSNREQCKLEEMILIDGAELLKRGDLPKIKGSNKITRFAKKKRVDFFDEEFEHQCEKIIGKKVIIKKTLCEKTFSFTRRKLKD